MQNSRNIRIIAVLVVAIIVVGGIVWAEGRGGGGGAPPTQDTSATPFVNPSLSKIPILVYHSIAPLDPTKPEDEMHAHYRVDPVIFSEQMDYLKNNGYHPITFNTLVQAILNNTPLPEKSVVLTFDDGWKNQYTYAVPVLEKDHIIATFFIITGYADGKYPAYMSWNQIISLDKAGMEIGSHTVDHLNLKTITPDKVQFEITQSKARLEQELGHPITTFAYPEYGQNPAIQAALKAAGYVGARAGWVSTPNSVATIYALKSQEVIDNPNPFTR